MRILHLTTEYPPLIYGGLGTAVGGLASASSHAGIEVAILLVGAGGDPSYRLPAVEARRERQSGISKVAGVLVHPVAHAAAEAYGARLIDEWRPDLLHLHVFWLWPLARALSAHGKIPLVYTAHSLDRAEYEQGDGPVECLGQWDTQAEVINAADRIVTLTCSEQDLLLSYCPGVKDRIRVVGNGIDDSGAARRAALGRKANKAPLILFTGRFVERKGVRDFLAAARAVLTINPATRFVLAGGHRHCDGETMARHWMPAELSAQRGQFEFTGWLSAEELARWYATADILVVPSWYEPFGMVVLEGMLYGLPIIATDIGGPAEILEPGRTGLLVPPRDPEQLARAIIGLIGAPQTRRRLGLVAARVVRQTWSYTRVVDEMRSVYDEAIAEAKLRQEPFPSGKNGLTQDRPRAN